MGGRPGQARECGGDGSQDRRRACLGIGAWLRRQRLRRRRAQRSRPVRRPHRQPDLRARLGHEDDHRRRRARPWRGRSQHDRRRRQGARLRSLARAQRRPQGHGSRSRSQDAIAFSRNVATAKVAMELGDNTTDSADVLYSMWQKLGFGRPTGIDLANEAAGITSNPDTTRWADIDLANRAFGQAVAVTPLQLAVAYSAMANGGRLVQPYLVASVDGKPTNQAEPQQVIDASLSQRLQQLMIHVLTTHRCCLPTPPFPGYIVGGKTGTAQFWDARANAWATRRLQLHVLWLRRSRNAGPDDRRPHQRGAPDRAEAQRADAARGAVVRPVPAHRAGSDRRARPAAAARLRPCRRSRPTCLPPTLPRPRLRHRTPAPATLRRRTPCRPIRPTLPATTRIGPTVSDGGALSGCNNGSRL